MTKGLYAKALNSCIENSKDADAKFIRLLFSYSFEEKTLKKYCLDKKKINKMNEDLVELSEGVRAAIYSLCKERWDLLIKLGGQVEVNRRHVGWINGIISNFFCKLRSREVPKYAKL